MRCSSVAMLPRQRERQPCCDTTWRRAPSSGLGRGGPGPEVSIRPLTCAIASAHVSTRVGVRRPPRAQATTVMGCSPDTELLSGRPGRYKSWQRRQISRRRRPAWTPPEKGTWRTTLRGRWCTAHRRPPSAKPEARLLASCYGYQPKSLQAQDIPSCCYRGCGARPPGERMRRRCRKRARDRRGSTPRERRVDVKNKTQ